MSAARACRVRGRAHRVVLGSVRGRAPLYPQCAPVVGSVSMGVPRSWVAPAGARRPAPITGHDAPDLARQMSDFREPDCRCRDRTSDFARGVTAALWREPAAIKARRPVTARPGRRHGGAARRRVVRQPLGDRFRSVGRDAGCCKEALSPARAATARSGHAHSAGHRGPVNARAPSAGCDLWAVEVRNAMRSGRSGRSVRPGPDTTKPACAGFVG